MARCSKKYMALVVTQSGFTPEKPWKKVLGINLPSIFEYEEWYNLAHEISDEAWRHYVVLGDLEGRTGSFPQWNRLREDANAMWAEREELVRPVLSGFDPTELGWKEDVQQAIQAAVDAACFMEKADGAIEDYGVPVPKAGVTPKTPERPGSKEGIGVLGTLGALVIAGGIVYGVVRFSNRGAPAPSEAA